MERNRKMADQNLADWAYRNIVCQDCWRGKSNHRKCQKGILLVNFLLCGQISDDDARSLYAWWLRGNNESAEWNAIGESLQIKISQDDFPKIECDPIGPNNIDYWELWQEIWR